jgi:para-nitrobenzyl esterase
VRFQGSDDNEVAPKRRDLYTIAFGAGGSLNVRFDCNRGRGTWKSPEASQLEFGPLALTRAMCPSQSLHDLMVRQWPFVRSYLVRQGHLFISLQADGGTFEFEPAPQPYGTDAASPLRGGFRECMSPACSAFR